MPSRIALGIGLAALVVAGSLAACGDDDDDDDDAATGLDADEKETVCDARDDLDEEVRDLGEVDFVDTSVSDIQGILDDIGDDISEISDVRSDQLQPFVADVRSSLDDLTDTLGDLGSSSSLSDAADSVTDALDQVKTSTQDLVTAAGTECN